ncbi:hypothetical protein F0562_012767 [Nyssa sinensis]|uniref:Myeloid leukemia factor 1 n=1 Tax=Nyssa sinensis TaxID=561372 RepID=A0A5J4ZV63_9ASTE|nr:hypothetical protein F0562_012767 [Nyssa sinensis]
MKIITIDLACIGTFQNSSLSPTRIASVSLRNVYKCLHRTFHLIGVFSFFLWNSFRLSIFISSTNRGYSSYKMQGNRGGRDPFFDFGDPFGGFGGQRSLLPSFFGGRDPFNDPFFTRPFGGMFESSFFGPTRNPFTDMHTSHFIEHQVPQPNKSRGPIIEELNLYDEREDDKEEKKDNPTKHGRSSKEPYVEDPDDEADARSKQMQYRNDFNRVNNVRTQPQTHSFTFQSSTVTYGGANGAYYTSSRTKRTGSDGLTIEESKEADTATRQAAHRIARGIHDKGHFVTRKLNSDGRVDTVQTLHNLNEEELSGFEEAWKANTRKHLPGWTEGLNVHDSMGSSSGGGNVLASRRGWALPSTEHSEHSGSMKPGSFRSQHSGRIKADGVERAGSNRGRSRAASFNNMDQARRH